MGKEPNTNRAEKVNADALEWHVRLHGGSASGDDWTTFTQWLEADPAHNEAYDIIALAWDDVGSLSEVIVRDHADTPELASNVIAFPLHQLRKAVSAKPWAFGGSFGAAIAATLLILMAPVFIGQNDVTSETFYATDIGEQRTIILADGSTVMLNTGTSIAVRMDKTTRLIDLQKGEASFTVQHENERSFVVAANTLRVTDIGTRFDVRMDIGRTRVSVTEGIVEVDSLPLENNTLPSSTSKIRLVEGQQAVHQADTVITVQPFDTTKVTAWQQGFLIFENDDLTDVIAELNRYFTNPVYMADVDLADLRFSGILQITDLDRAVRDLTTLLSLSAVETETGIALRHISPANSQ